MSPPARITHGSDTVASLRARLARLEHEAAERERQLERYAADLREIIITLDYRQFQDRAWEDKVPLIERSLSLPQPRAHADLVDLAWEMFNGLDNLQVFIFFPSVV